MEFLNDQVQLENLPRVENVSLTPIHPSYLKVLRWEWLIMSAILGILVAILLYFIEPLRQALWISLIVGGWILIAAAWYWLQEKSFRTKAYAIREKDVIYRSGWIIESTHTCPFNRIQHSAVTIGPLEKRFGLASLVLYTAGSNEADLRIRGLQEATAWTLKEWITKKVADDPITGE
jgi:membrane protein YdbS with pleckstrin-like domain